MKEEIYIYSFEVWHPRCVQKRQGKERKKSKVVTLGNTHNTDNTKITNRKGNKKD
jgi:hypothetical protein